MMVGVAQRQLHGRWDTTTSNAWGTIAVRKFAQSYPATAITGTRSEEHTSELQSLMRISYAVFCLKKKNTNVRQKTTHDHIRKQQNQNKTRHNSHKTD